MTSGEHKQFVYKWQVVSINSYNQQVTYLLSLETVGLPVTAVGDWLNA